MHRSSWLLLCTVVLAACGTEATAQTPGPSAGAAIEGSWRLQTGTSGGRAVPVLDDHPITLTIDGTELTGRAACNGYGARMSFADGRPAIGEIGQELVGCHDDVMASEAAYLEALRRVTAFSIEEGELVLGGPETELRYAVVAPPPTAELVDTAWRLETVFVGDVAETPIGEPATLALRSDGTFTGSTGCRSFSGRWVEHADQIVATSLSMDQQDCPAELSRQDSQIVTVIGDGFVPSIEDELLTLLDPGGVGLVYRAEDDG